MNIKGFLRSSRARIIAAFVSAALVITGLVVWNPLGLSAQAAGGDGSGECIVGETDLKDCFGNAVNDVVLALKQAGETTARPDDELTREYVDLVHKLSVKNVAHIKNFDKFTKLESLSVEGAFVPAEEFGVLQKLTGLKELTLHDTQVSDMQVFNKLHDLKVLDIDNLKQNVPPDGRHLELLKVNNPNLESLTISSSHLGHEIYNNNWTLFDGEQQGQTSNLKWIEGLNSLKSVDFHDNDIQDPSALNTLPHLTKINLEKNHIYDLTSLKETLARPEMTEFKGEDQTIYFSPATIETPNDTYKLKTAIIDSGASQFAAIKNTATKPSDDKDIVSTKVGYAEWNSPKVSSARSKLYSLTFGDTVGDKHFPFAGYIVQQVQVQVTFYDENGTELARKVIASSQQVPFPAVEKRGYDAYWKLGDPNAENYVQTDHVFDSAAHVYLTYKVHPYDVKYVANNTGDVKSMPADHTADFGTAIAKPGDPSVYGWKFKGWSTTADGTTGLYDFRTTVEADVTLYARWERVPFKVSFKESAGDKEIADSQKVLFEDKATIPSAPTKEGHTFKGWVDEAGNPFDFNNTPITKDTVLYPLWDINRYKVQFETGDPKVPNPQQQGVDYNKTASKPDDPNKLGHVLEGWTTDEAGKNPYDFNTPVKADIVLHAKWRKAKVNIDDRTGAAVTKVEVADNGIPAKPKDPTREGYDFVGWSLTPDGSNPWNFDSPVPDNQTIFGVWSQITNPVEFDTQGGSAVPTQTVKYKEYANKPTDPVREGFKFVEWTSDKEGKNAFNISKTPITSKTVVYAQWEKNKYVVDFETGDRDVINPDMQTVEHGGLVKRPADPTRKGHEFIGWTADPEGTIPFDFSTKITTNTKIYAQWKKIGSPVSPNGNESSPSLDKAGEPSGNKNNADPSDPAAESQQSLARTGSQILGILGIGVALLAAASVLLVFAKKRHDN